MYIILCCTRSLIYYSICQQEEHKDGTIQEEALEQTTTNYNNIKEGRELLGDGKCQKKKR